MGELAEFLRTLPPFGWLGGAICIVTLLGFLFKWIRAAIRVGRKLDDFLGDWQGEPARPGVPARLGILERVANVEAQLKTNGGSSLKDQTNRIERALADLRQQFTSHVVASGDREHPKGSA